MVILLALIMGTAFIAGDLSQPDFAVFNVINTSEPQYLIKEFGKGIVLWKENKEIIKGLISIENLPTELIEQNKKLLDYCDLRIQHNEIIVKAISEDTDKYVSEIDRIGMEINKILEELK